MSGKQVRSKCQIWSFLVKSTIGQKLFHFQIRNNSRKGAMIQYKTYIGTYTTKQDLSRLYVLLSWCSAWHGACEESPPTCLPGSCTARPTEQGKPSQESTNRIPLGIFPTNRIWQQNYSTNRIKKQNFSINRIQLDIFPANRIQHKISSNIRNQTDIFPTNRIPQHNYSANRIQHQISSTRRNQIDIFLIDRIQS